MQGSSGQAPKTALPADGMIVFSGAQLHSSIPNTTGETRLSIDFRTVHLGDARLSKGAPNVDSKCSGTTMGDYLRGTDLEHLPQDLIAQYDAEERVPSRAAHRNI